MESLIQFFTFKGEKEKLLFRSYWVHTIFQLLALILFWAFGNQYVGLVLAFFLNYTLLVIAYVSFQFPITGFLLVLANRWKESLSQGQDLTFRIVFSSGIFVIMASSIVFILVHLAGIWYIQDWGFSETSSFLLTYICPVIFVGELFRQRWVLKKLYTDTYIHENRKTK